MNKTANIEVDGKKYERIPVKTRLISIKEPLDDIFAKQVKPLIKPGDWIAISEKVVTISQGRVVHISVVKPSRLAKMLVKGVKKYENDIGYSLPAKMQVAIWQTGYLRMTLAAIIGTLSRLIGRRGDFYRIAGNRISEIDGFNPHAMPPFDEFAMIGPGEPKKYCQWVEDTFSIPTVVIDGNNINVEVLGMSKGVPVSAKLARLILLDNPMGQDDEKTPIMIVRQQSN
ncbi:MAG TPA: coenzyme F420-0:L-glutamate ligase [Candidatus Angelobacter sp.]|nr:coenzyme F420-0:L-glutamate ligase [Candidatus Angelobacter sp.]